MFEKGLGEEECEHGILYRNQQTSLESAVTSAHNPLSVISEQSQAQNSKLANNELEAINIVENNGKISQRGHYKIQRSSLDKYLESKKIKPLPSKSSDIHRQRNFSKVKNHLGL
ncbi:MAG: hypothetical protein HQ517_03790 [SAR324 cluster bacterium]|nr:hypothetical protein [SAR324 cluster bacterium]